MRLVILSNMAHWRRSDGVIVGHGATARELSVLASLFTSVRHVACLHDEEPPASARAYDADNIELVPVPPAGGDSFEDKIGIVRYAPLYTRTMLRELRCADAVHVRCPANITLFALGILAARSAPTRRWIKYAGNWRPTGPEPWSYRLQRRWLEHSSAGAQVTINGEWPGQPAHVHTIANPSLTSAELARGRAAAERKQLEGQIRLVFVGHLGAAKNPQAAIAALVELRARGLDARLDIVGEGDQLETIRAGIVALGVSEYVVLHGPLAREAIDALYDAAHFVVLPSLTEGWPKVLGEGMASGAVPISTAVGSIPEILGRAGTGVALPLPVQPGDIVAVIEAYVADPSRWRSERDLAVTAAHQFSYESYLTTVRGLLALERDDT